MKLFYLLILCFLLFSCQKKIKSLENPSPSKTNDLELYDFPYGNSNVKKIKEATPEEIKLVEGTIDDFQISYGRESGNCLGFCKVNIKFSSNGILKNQTRYPDSISFIEYFSIEKTTYYQLINSINFEEFKHCNVSPGPGDTVDAGWEFISIQNGSDSKEINFTYGKDISGLGVLLDYLRKI